MCEGEARSEHHRGTTVEYYAGIGVSLEQSSVCVVDGTGRMIREAKVLSEPEALIAWFAGLPFSPFSRRARGARHRAADASRLVPARAWQVSAGTGDPGIVDGPQAGSGQAATVSR